MDEEPTDRYGLTAEDHARAADLLAPVLERARQRAAAREAAKAAGVPSLADARRRRRRGTPDLGVDGARADHES